MMFDQLVESCEVRGVQDPSRNLGTDPGSDSSQRSKRRPEVKLTEVV